MRDTAVTTRGFDILLHSILMGTPTSRSSASKKERGVKVGLDRFEKILRLGRRRTGATMEELKTELEVSQASVKRDITFLRNRMC